MRVTTKEQLATWLDSLLGEYRVIAPRQESNQLFYRAITSSSEVVFDFQRTDMSPKTHTLPSTEVLMNIEKCGDEIALDPQLPQQEQVLFAVRPCDARALNSMDALLVDQEPADTYYAERRRKTALVGLACPQMWDLCFCTSLGGGPDDSSDMDVMLYQVDDGYLVEAITERGETLLQSLAGSETDRTAPVSERYADLTTVLPPDQWGGLFNDIFWKRFTERCLSCHACTYVCPTCRCFDVRDYATDNTAEALRYERLRTWDSCMASAYRRIAGGHNPRADKAQRLRNRYYCKFCYSPQTFDTVACVGCGRCIDVCPVAIDIVEMLEEVNTLAEAAA